MTYGLRVINDDSELLIDSNFTNPAFVQKVEFSGTPTSETIEPVRGFQKRIHTATIPNPGNYIVMWTLPESPGYNDGTVGANGYYKMLYYHFPTSTTVPSNLTLSITVFVYGAASAFTYKLPTAYLFAVTDLPSNGSHGLRLFNDSGQKTFDSNNIQLVPTAISENFQFWEQTGWNIVNLPPAAGTTMDLSTSGTDPIFFLPNYYQYKVYQVPPNFNTWAGSVYVPVFYRSGNSVQVTEYTDTTTSGTGTFPGGDENRIPGSFGIGWEYTSGNRASMAVVAANSSLYAAPIPGTATGTSPNFTLSVFSDPFPAQEGGTITVQISTTNVPNGTAYGYTVTGINAADLSAGSLTGTLVINQNVGTVNFTLANDNLTEGTETFVYTIENTPYSVTMDITDTSQTQSYSWSTPASINEGSSGSLSFNFSGALNKSVTFSVIYGTNVNSSDVTLNTTSYTIPSNSAGSTAVSYSVAADATTEGTEYFQLRATVNGVNYDSNSITINDTSTTPPPIVGISANSPPWSENSTRVTNISLSNVNGFVYYPTSDNANVTCQTTSFTVTGSTYTAILYWTVGEVAADTTVNLYLRRSSASGTIDAQTSVLVKNILPAGTPIGSPYCSLGYGVAPYTITQVYADGSGGTYTDNQYNSPTCGYVAPTYSLSASPTTVNEGASFVITLTTNQSGSFPYTITGVSSADIGSTSLTGSLSNGGTRTISVTADAFTEGTEYFVVTLDNGAANVTVTINDTSKNVTSVQRNTFTGPLNSDQNAYNSVSFFHNVGGAISPSQWSYTGNLPPGMLLSQEGNPFGNYYNSYTLAGSSGGSGNYTFTLYATNSGGDSAQATFTYTVTAPVYPAAGTTSGGQYCGTGANIYTLYQNYHDGFGGIYISIVAYNSPSCGYVAPAYTLYGAPTSINNNSSYTSFYVRSTNANGVTITPSLSGAGAARCSVSPTSRTISNNGTVDSYFTITTTLPTATIAEQSVTLSVAGLSFTFTIPAYTVSAASAPTVTSVTVNQTFYEPGEQVIAVINFSGPITSDTYLNIRFSASSYGQLYTPGYLTAVGPPGGGNVYGDIQLLVGATSASYVSWSNPGDFTVNNGRIYAMTMTAPNNGSARQTAVMSPAFVLQASGGGGGQIEN